MFVTNGNMGPMVVEGETDLLGAHPPARVCFQMVFEINLDHPLNEDCPPELSVIEGDPVRTLSEAVEMCRQASSEWSEIEGVKVVEHELEQDEDDGQIDLPSFYGIDSAGPEETLVFAVSIRFIDYRNEMIH